ncbi:MAG: RagB/SusD family nutrient uptake outer membrane protein [Rikenellaceae bacterium]|nr:RagB/SusD family nutrient uptake outer membrane protein [Rikenellaceae bacterium]MCL2692754.1 RagB/SusD family nutrient uptake outer membrane protein [Rikenellaceae bacterium]
MKKHISLLICFTATLTFVSCSDWLDVKPSTQLDREELLSSEKGYGEAIAGIYARMCRASLYGREMTWGAMDVLAGNYTALTLPAMYNGIKEYAYVESGGSSVSTDAVRMLEQFWSGLYNVIAGINSILENIDDNRYLFTEDNYSVIKGEAIGLRAFLHFELYRMFADVYEKSKDQEILPYVVKLTPLVTPLLTGEEMMSVIISQLEEAVRLLENDPMRLGTTPPHVLASSTSGNISAWHNRRFHFNYYAAKATLARVYLWKGDKENALRTALEVIDDQPTRFPWVLTTNLTSIELGSGTNQDRTFATEHIFALNVMNMDNLISGFLNNIPVSDGTNLRLTSMRNMFATNDQGVDPRFRYMYTMHSANEFMLSKFYQPAMVSSHFKYRMPLIRISEMYYIVAECADNWEDGLEYLEIVRRQRGYTTMPLTNVNNQQTLLNEIYTEYRKEFTGEGQLWFWYKRQQSPAITNMTFNRGLEAYIFPYPENEILYGNREL